MKNLTLVLAATFLLTAVVVGQDKKAEDRHARILQLAEQNLKLTLTKGNDDLKESAMAAVADLRREYPAQQFTTTAIPLMRILRTHEESGMRILAAMTLKEIGDERGSFAIYEASKFDNNQTVRHICSSLK
ncbi:MAG: hypothetical protein KDC45_04175 [Bacteroidetes bacterium]|nr:hypothetical protein [Bacteroidota bacterium]